MIVFSIHGHAARKIDTGIRLTPVNEINNGPHMNITYLFEGVYSAFEKPFYNPELQCRVKRSKFRNIYLYFTVRRITIQKGETLFHCSFDKIIFHSQDTRQLTETVNDFRIIVFFKIRYEIMSHSVS